MRAQSEVDQDLKQLLMLDSRLLPISKIVGEVLWRSRPPGFEGLARIICGQQISVHSANAIWQRLAERHGTRFAQAIPIFFLSGIWLYVKPPRRLLIVNTHSRRLNCQIWLACWLYKSKA